MNVNVDNCDVVDAKKRIAPKKPPRLSIRGKIGGYPKQDKDKRNTKDINSDFKKVNEDKANTSRPGTTPCQHEEDNHITKEEQKAGEHHVPVIKKETSVETEHIYESISDSVATKNTSSQTEEYSPGLHHFAKVFKETSCQTECTVTPDTAIKRNKKRNSNSSNEEMATLGKTKECRLSDASSASRDSGDSGHFSAQVYNNDMHSEHNQYLWQPEGLTNEEVKSFMDSLPRGKVPSKFSPDGQSYFKTQLAYQNPEQDTDPTLCQSLTKNESVALGNVWMKCIKARRTGKVEFSEGAGNACKSCGVLFHEGEVTVAISNGGLHHLSCFQCTVCHEHLAKLIYHSAKDRLFCARHFAELFKSRCNGCNELILSGKVVTAVNSTWHAEHFCCAKCGDKITENKYTKDQEKPICLNCHATHFAADCKGCGKKIVIGQKRLSHGDTHWHDECFICEKCKNTLVLGTFNLADENVVCPECYRQNRGKLCYKCGDEIKPGNASVTYDNKFYHDACFSCKSCSKPVSTGFLENEGSFYCTTCHENLFSQKCIHCDLPVTGNGVTHNNEVWHSSCFDCFYCHKPISSQRFLVRFGNRYCNGCYEKMFAKECHSCSKLIKDNEEYLTSNDLSWHNNCFRCASCQKNLGNIGFHMLEQKTYCPECP